MGDSSVSRRPRGTAGTRRLLVSTWDLLNSVRGLEIIKVDYLETSTLETSNREVALLQRSLIQSGPSDPHSLPASSTPAATATDPRIQHPEIRICPQAMVGIAVLHRAMGVAAHHPIETETDMTTDTTTIESHAALFHPLVMTTAETAGTIPTAEEGLHHLVTTLLMRAATTIVL